MLVMSWGILRISKRKCYTSIYQWISSACEIHLIVYIAGETWSDAHLVLRRTAGRETFRSKVNSSESGSLFVPQLSVLWLGHSNSVYAIVTGVNALQGLGTAVWSLAVCLFNYLHPASWGRFLVQLRQGIVPARFFPFGLHLIIDGNGNEGLK